MSEEETKVTPIGGENAAVNGGLQAAPEVVADAQAESEAVEETVAEEVEVEGAATPEVA